VSDPERSYLYRKTLRAPASLPRATTGANPSGASPHSLSLPPARRRRREPPGKARAVPAAAGSPSPARLGGLAGRSCLAAVLLVAVYLSGCLVSSSLARRAPGGATMDHGGGVRRRRGAAERRTGLGPIWACHGPGGPVAAWNGQRLGGPYDAGGGGGCLGEASMHCRPRSGQAGQDLAAPLRLGRLGLCTGGRCCYAGAWILGGGPGQCGCAGGLDRRRRGVSFGVARPRASWLGCSYAASSVSAVGCLA
jgi:hypothetical protein